MCSSQGLGLGIEQLEPLVTLATQLPVSHPDQDCHTFLSQHQANQAAKEGWTWTYPIPSPHPAPQHRQGRKQVSFFSQPTEDEGRGG